MLEQAIIDAEALKEAAIKNAEQAVLEKYSNDIQQAVETLLEQDEEDPFAVEDEMGLGDEIDAEDREGVIDQLDMAATGGEDACPCPEDEEPVVLDLDQIMAAAEGEEEAELGAEEEIAATEEELFEINREDVMSAVMEELSAKQKKIDLDDDGDVDKKDLQGLRAGKEDEDVGEEKEEKEKKVDEGTKGYRKGDPSRGKPSKEDEDDPIDYEKKTKSGKGEKIAGKVFEDSGEEEKRHYKDNREEDDRHLASLKKDYEYDKDKPGDDASEEEKEHYRRNREDDKKHIDNLEKDKDYDKEHEPLEESNFTDDQLNDILEALTVDLENVPSGDMFHTHQTMGQNERGLDVALAQEQDTEFAEEQKELRQALKKLQEQIKSQKLLLNKREKDYKNLKSIALKATKKLEEVNFSNAKLIYTNRILKNDSLNERQKTKLAEAISKVGSVEEAKIVFETLQENLASKGHNTPTTLNEAVVSKNNRLILKSNIEKQPATNNQVDRLKKLAGII